MAIGAAARRHHGIPSGVTSGIGGSASLGLAMLLRSGRGRRQQPIAQPGARRDRLDGSVEQCAGVDQATGLGVWLVALREMRAQRSLLVRLDRADGVGRGERVDRLAVHRPLSPDSIGSPSLPGATAASAKDDLSLPSASRSLPAAVPAGTPVRAATSL